MTSDSDIAIATLFNETDIDHSQLPSLLGDMMSPSLDMGEFFFQNNCSESWILENGIVKNGSFSTNKGFGVRAISGEKTGFSFADNISQHALLQASQAARSIVTHQGSATQPIKVTPTTLSDTVYTSHDPLLSLEPQAKQDLLRHLDTYIRSMDERVVDVTIVLAGSHQTNFVIATDGTLCSDIRPLVRISISVIVEENGRRESGSSGGGGRLDYQHFLDNKLAETYAKQALDMAVTNLSSIAAPAGVYPVILANGWPAVLIHEAVGHGLEGDFNRKGSSVYSGKIGHKVASEHCSIVDNGQMHQARGSLNVDDEGTPSQCNVLIENGVLKQYMQDKLNAKLMQLPTTGNGRRESYAHTPMPRMTNTYMLPGKYEPSEIIESVQKGIYAVSFGGGQVDITSGQFVFSATEAYLIENGKITSPIKGATLIGEGFDVMQNISMVANDLQLDTGIGVCGKSGQSVPVGVGQPTLKIDKLTVGGTSQ